jgi:hypothetical protein
MSAAYKKETIMVGDVRSRFTRYNNLFGRNVYSADGQKIGMFDQVVFSSFRETPYLLVKTGPLGRLFYTDALYIPEAALEKVSDDAVIVKMTMHEIQESGLGNAPLGVDRW